MQLINKLPNAYAALVLAATAASFSAIFIKGSNAPGMVAGFYRMAGASLVMAWPFYRQLRQSGIPPLSTTKLAVLCGFLLGVDTVVWSSSVSLGNATTPTLITHTSPLWVGIGTTIFFRTNLRLGFWIGCVISLLGTAIIIGIDDNLKAVSLSSLLAFSSSIIFAAFLLFAEKARKNMAAISFYWIVTAIACLTTLVANMFFSTELTGYPYRTYLNFIGLALVPQVIGWVALTYSLGQLPATLVSTSFLAQPIITALLAVLILGESLKLTEITGGATVLIGIFIVHRNMQKIIGTTTGK